MSNLKRRKTRLTLVATSITLLLLILIVGYASPTSAGAQNSTQTPALAATPQPAPIPTPTPQPQDDDLTIKDILTVRDLGLLIAAVIVQVIGTVVGVYLLKTAAAKEDLLKTTYEREIAVLEERLALESEKCKPLQELLEERSKLLKAREEELARAKEVLENERESLRKEREQLVPSEPVALRAITLAPQDRQRLDTLTQRIDRIEQLSVQLVPVQKAPSHPAKSARDYFSDAFAYHKLGRNEQAIAAYQKTIELDPDFVYAYNNLGIVYHDLGQHEQAIAAFQRAIELDPNLAAPYNGLGNVYRALGQLEQAIAEYQCAIELDPNDAASQASFAAACRDLGRQKEYDEHIQRSRELMANESDYNKACIESIAGNVDAALAHLARGLEKAPGLRAWARRDPDLAFMRDDVRFWALVERSDNDL